MMDREFIDTCLKLEARIRTLEIHMAAINQLMLENLTSEVLQRLGALQRQFEAESLKQIEANIKQIEQDDLLSRARGPVQ